MKSVSAANATTPNYNTLHTVLINVTFAKFDSNINSFQVVCYNQQHGVFENVSVSNEANSFTTRVGGLYPSSIYTCCTSTNSKAYYYEHCQQFMARGTCVTIKTPNNNTSNQSESKALTSIGIVGGILGSLVAVLLIIILLLLSVIALVLRPDLMKYVIPKTR